MKTVLAICGHVTRKGIPIERQAPLGTESLGLAYLLAGFAHSGQEAVAIDGYQRGWSIEETIRQILAEVEDNSLVGFSVSNASAAATKLATERLRANNFRGKIVLGGWEASLAPIELLEFIKDADWILQGEAEAALPSLARRVASGHSTASIPGLIRRGAPLTAFRYNTVDFVRPLFPKHYSLAGGSPSDRPLPIQTSRGCAYGLCTFCTTPGTTGSSWRPRAVEYVLAELETDLDRHNAHDRIFVDDEFFGPSKRGLSRATRLVDAIIDARLNLDLTLDCRVCDYEPELFDRLMAAGVKRVFLGIDSGSNGVLKRFAKGYSATVARDCLRGIYKHGFELIPGYILFEPFMTLAELREAFDFLVEEVSPLTPTKFLNRAVPYVGTALHRKVRDAGLMRGDYPDLTYQFQDDGVERFYRSLKSQSESLVSQYKYQINGASSAEIKSCTQGIITLFDRLLQRAGH